MREPRRAATGLALAGLVALGAGACDWNDPDEIQNESNYAIVRAQFFTSRASREPVPGVRMVVEAPEEAQRPYNGPDVVAISGEDGIATAKVFPGLQTQQGGGAGGGGDGGTGGTGTTPTDPFEVPPSQVFADVAVTIVYNGQIAAFIGGGLTIGSGRMYDLGSVFLADFGIVAD